MAAELGLSLTRVDATISILAVVGEIDPAATPGLRRAINEVLAALPTGKLTLDFAGVPFLSCAGVAVLITAALDARERGLTVTVINCDRVVRRLLELTDVADLLLG